MEKHNLEGYSLIGCTETNHIGGVRWMDVVDELMQSHIQGTHLPLLAKLFPSDYALRSWSYKRFLTYAEYEAIFGRIDCTNPIYLVAGITNEAGQKQFCISHDASKQGYFQFMQEANPQLWEFFFTWRDVAIPRKERKMHTYSIGASGCGKTALMNDQILQDVKMGNATVMFIDPNGDAALQLAKNVINLGTDRLAYIDPFLDREMTPVLNPFDLPNKQLYFGDRMYKLIVEKRASQIMQALIQIFAENDAKFSEKMQTYLYPAICVVMLKDNGDMRDLLRLFDEGDKTDLIELGKRSPNEEHRLLFQQGFTVPKMTCDAVRDKIKNMLNHGNLSDLITGKSTFDLEELIESKKFIIFNLAKGKLDPKPSMYYGKFIISTIQSIIFQRAVQEERDRTPVYLYIDESHNYINDDLKEILNEGRKYGVHVYLVSQTLWQEMTPSIRDAVAGNTNIKIVGELRDMTKLDQLASMLDVDKETVRTLPKYKFLVKVGKNKTFVMSPSTKNLDGKNTMSPEQWKVVVNSQKEKYYRLIHKPKMKEEPGDTFKPKFSDE